MIRFLIFKIRIRPAFEEWKSESDSSPRDLNRSPKRSGYLFHLKHITTESHEINNVSRRRLRRSDRTVVTLIRSCIVGRGFDLVFLQCEQRLHIREAITPHALTPTGWIFRPGARNIGSYKRDTRPHTHTTEDASKFNNEWKLMKRLDQIQLLQGASQLRTSNLWFQTTSWEAFK